MNKIIMTFDVPDDVDPALVDPFDIAREIVGEFNDWARANNGTRVGELSLDAEWVEE